MGDSLSWARDQERDEEERRERKEARDIRENMKAEWDDWSLTKMEMVEIISDLEYDDEETVRKLLKNWKALETYFKTQRAIAEGKLL